jgi:hypothetical protein
MLGMDYCIRKQNGATRVPTDRTNRNLSSQRSSLVIESQSSNQIERRQCFSFNRWHYLSLADKPLIAANDSRRAVFDR